MEYRERPIGTLTIWGRGLQRRATFPCLDRSQYCLVMSAWGLVNILLTGWRPPRQGAPPRGPLPLWGNAETIFALRRARTSRQGHSRPWIECAHAFQQVNYREDVGLHTFAVAIDVAWLELQRCDAVEVIE